MLQLNWSLEPDGFLPGAHTHPHQQECFEVLSGTLGVRVGRRKYKLGAGEAVVVPPGAVHGRRGYRGRYPEYSAQQSLIHPTTDLFNFGQELSDLQPLSS